MNHTTESASSALAGVKGKLRTLVPWTLAAFVIAAQLAPWRVLASLLVLTVAAVPLAQVLRRAESVLRSKRAPTLRHGEVVAFLAVALSLCGALRFLEAPPAAPDHATAAADDDAFAQRARLAVRVLDGDAAPQLLLLLEYRAAALAAGDGPRAARVDHQIETFLVEQQPLRQQRAEDLLQIELALRDGTIDADTAADRAWSRLDTDARQALRDLQAIREPEVRHRRIADLLGRHQQAYRAPLPLRTRGGDALAQDPPMPGGREPVAAPLPDAAPVAPRPTAATPVAAGWSKSHDAFAAEDLPAGPGGASGRSATAFAAAEGATTTICWQELDATTGERRGAPLPLATFGGDTAVTVRFCAEHSGLVVAELLRRDGVATVVLRAFGGDRDELPGAALACLDAPDHVGLLLQNGDGLRWLAIAAASTTRIDQPLAVDATFALQLLDELLPPAPPAADPTGAGGGMP